MLACSATSAKALVFLKIFPVGLKAHSPGLKAGASTGCAQIQEELRNQYSIGYTPDRHDPGAGYHKIHLAARQKELIVQTRDGYYWKPST